MEFPEPRPDTGDAATLFALYLDWYRETAIRKVASLDPSERRTTRLPSGWTPLELLTHLAHMERRWFVWGFLGEAVDEELAKAVGFSTKGLAARDFVDRIGRQLTMTVSIDSSAQAELAAGEKVHDELVGLSIGTALAAGLRPSGLIFRPVVAGGRVELAVRVARGEKELWPIGRRPTPPTRS